MGTKQGRKAIKDAISSFGDSQASGCESGITLTSDNKTHNDVDQSPARPCVCPPTLCTLTAYFYIGVCTATEAERQLASRLDSQQLVLYHCWMPDQQLPKESLPLHLLFAQSTHRAVRALGRLQTKVETRGVPRFLFYAYFLQDDDDRCFDSLDDLVQHYQQEVGV